MNDVSPRPATPVATPPVRDPMAGLRIHFIAYAVVVSFLAGLNYYLGEPYWFIYVLGGWGVGVAGHGFGAYMKKRSQQA